MIPTTAIRRKAMQLLAADAATLAPVADEIFIGLVKEQFNSSEALAFAGITLADFDGSDPIPLTVGAQDEGIDPVDNSSRIDLSPPIGGFRFVVTGATNLPQTIYGYVLLNHAKTGVLASELLETPINLTAIDQVIDVGDPILSLPFGSMR